MIVETFKGADMLDFNKLVDIVTKVKNLEDRHANDSLDVDQLEDIAAELAELKDEVSEVLNDFDSSIDDLIQEIDDEINEEEVPAVQLKKPLGADLFNDKPSKVLGSEIFEDKKKVLGSELF
jgi:hypothetical protein